MCFWWLFHKYCNIFYDFYKIFDNFCNFSDIFDLFFTPFTIISKLSVKFLTIFGPTTFYVFFFPKYVGILLNLVLIFFDKLNLNMKKIHIKIDVQNMFHKSQPQLYPVTTWTNTLHRVITCNSIRTTKPKDRIKYSIRRTPSS